MGKLIGFDFVYWDDDPDWDKVNARFREILKKCMQMTKNKTPHMLTFYFGGHGVNDKEQQIMVLNTNVPEKAIYQI